MGIQLRLILAAFCAANLFSFIRSLAFDQVDNEREVRLNNLQNLFGSIAREDTQKSGIYRNILKQDEAKEKPGFDIMKEELQNIQYRNIQKKKDVNDIIIHLGEREKRQTENGNETVEQSDTDTSAEISNSTVYVRTQTTTLTPLQTFGTRSMFNEEAKPVVAKNVERFLRQQTLDIFPNKNGDDPFTPALFREFTGMEGLRVSRRSFKKVHGAIKAREFRAFIREMNIYARRVPFDKLVRNPDDNRDGLYYRAAFYLLLRCFNFLPTPYFYDLMQEHSVISVETPEIVYLFAVNLGQNVDYDFNVTMNVVDGNSSSKLLPRDTKMILCAGIQFDTQFDPKLRHFRAVLRDKTRVKKEENVDSTAVTIMPFKFV